MLPAGYEKGYAISTGYQCAYLYYNNQSIDCVWSDDEQELEQKLQNLIYEYLPSWYYVDQEYQPHPTIKIMYRQVAAA